MTEPTFGIDVSANQGAIDWAKVKASGVQFAVARATLGVATDHDYAAFVKGMRTAGLIPGAYHYLYHDEPSTAARQADHFMDVIGDPDGLLVALDAEQTLTPDYDRVTRDDAQRFADRWYARYPGHRLLAYCPGWFWSAGPPSAFGPLWNSRYVSLRYASLSRIYADVPSSWWSGYGNWPAVTILQFTSGARVPGAGYPIDGNAFRGTRDQLAAYARSVPTGGPLQPPIVPPTEPVPKEPEMVPLPSNDPTPKLVDVPAGAPWYDLAGVSDGGAHSALTDFFSPYGVHNGTSQFRLILAGQPNGDSVAVLVKPSTTPRDVVDLTPFDQADIDAATLSLKEELALATAKVTALETDVDKAALTGFESARTVAGKLIAEMSPPTINS